ncbi:MAG: 4Fe-4S binding protein [Candidatus Caldarchaeum sp.]
MATRAMLRQRIRKPAYGRWRAISLTLVYVFFVIHFLHWKIAGKTLAPLELHEVMYTLELGVVTAGFLFMTLAALSTFVGGRFFCSWLCHFLALQDLCAWLLKKLKIKPKPVRSRFLPWVAWGTFFYMFLYPTLRRLAMGEPSPKWHIVSDPHSWSSFITADLWRNLPGPTITILTFSICGFLIVYLLGTRSFCQFICPYGVFFGIGDRFATGRIRLDSTRATRQDCLACGLCTAECQSHIRVHEEVARYGAVVNPNCLKDLDCVAVCPREALRFGWGAPSWLRSPHKARSYDFSLLEEGLMTIMFFAGLFTFRGLYDAVPFLMGVGAAVCLAFLSLMAVRLIIREHVRLNNFQLKRGGRFTLQGRFAMSFLAALGAFTVHSAFIRYHEFRGTQIFDQIRVSHSSDKEQVKQAVRHLEFVHRMGFFRSLPLEQKLASLHSVLGDSERTLEHLEHVVARDSRDIEARVRLGGVLLRQGRWAEAVSHLTFATSLRTKRVEEQRRYQQLRAEAWELLGSLNVFHKNWSEAIRCYQLAIQEDPKRLQSYFYLAKTYEVLGLIEQAEAVRRAAEETERNRGD